MIRTVCSELNVQYTTAMTAAYCKRIKYDALCEGIQHSNCDSPSVPCLYDDLFAITVQLLVCGKFDKWIRMSFFTSTILRMQNCILAMFNL